MLTQQEISEIMQKCVELGIKGMYEGEAVNFAKQQGKEVIDPMLAGLARERNNRAAKDKRAIGAGPSLRKLMLNYTNRKAAEDKRWAEHDRMTEEYNKSYDSGYRPTTEAIGEQLNDLLDLGDISTEEYEIGMRFLDGDESRRVGNLGGALGELSEGVRE